MMFSPCGENDVASLMMNDVASLIKVSPLATSEAVWILCRLVRAFWFDEMALLLDEVAFGKRCRLRRTMLPSANMSIVNCQLSIDKREVFL